MSYNISIHFLKFNTVFNEKRKSAECYFHQISKKAIFLLLITWLNDRSLIESTIPNQSKEQLDYLLFLLDRSKNEHLSIKIRNLVKSSPHLSFLWINPYTTLELIDLILSNYHNEILDDTNQFMFSQAEVELSQLGATDYLHILKGYLSQLQMLVDSRSLNYNLDREAFYHQQIAERLKTFEYENKDYGFIYFLEILKGFEYFKFLEEKYPLELEEFLKNKHLQFWKEYMTISFEFAGIFLENNRVKIFDPETAKRDISFLETMVLTKSEFTKNVHFKSFKRFPLLKYNNHCYLAIYKVFVFEKIYKPLRFETLDIGKIGKYFFEEWLCTRVVNEIFPKYNYNYTDSSEVFNSLKMKPDQIIRLNNDVYIFEYKDTFLTDITKHSEDIEKIIEELKNKLLTTKGVGQLVNAVINYDKFHEKVDSKESLENLHIYPILIVQDRSLSVPGLNKIINWWFSKQIDEKLDKKNTYQVSRLTLMNIDTLLYCKSWFSEDPSIFKNTIDMYNRYDSNESNKLVYSFSYDSWMKEKIISQNDNQQRKIAINIKKDIQRKFSI